MGDGRDDQGIELTAYLRLSRYWEAWLANNCSLMKHWWHFRPGLRRYWIAGHSLHSSDDPEDPEPLTYCFCGAMLTYHLKSSSERITTVSDVSDKHDISRMWSGSDGWRNMYLILSECQKWMKERRNVASGDLLPITRDSITLRPMTRGCVLEGDPDRKGVVRLALVRTAITMTS